MIQNLAHKQMTIETFSNTLKDNSPEIRARSAEVLGVIGSYAEVPGLIDALKDSDPQVRLNATKALAKIGDENAIPALCKLLSEDPNDAVRSSAANALGRIGKGTAQNLVDDSDIEASQFISVFTKKIQQLLTQLNQMLSQTPEIHQSIAQLLQQQPDLKHTLYQFLTPTSIQLLIKGEKMNFKFNEECLENAIQVEDEVNCDIQTGLDFGQDANAYISGTKSYIDYERMFEKSKEGRIRRLNGEP
jgi:HEAT repeats